MKLLLYIFIYFLFFLVLVIVDLKEEIKITKFHKHTVLGGVADPIL